MFFPIMIDIEKFNILVVGGGKIAYRKIIKLLEYGAEVSVVSIEFCEEIKALNGKIELKKKKFEIKDIKGYNIVFAATDNIEVNKEISEYCIERKIPVNSVDNHENSTFINMGFFETEIEDRKTIVAVSSMGKSPKGTKAIKEKLKKILEKKSFN